MTISIWKVRSDLNGNVVYTAAISEDDAKNGGLFEISPGDRPIKLNLKPGLIVSGSRMRLKGEGELPWAHGPRGDLYLEFQLRKGTISPVDKGLATASVMLVLWIAGGIWLHSQSETVSSGTKGVVVLVPIGLAIFVIARLVQVLAKNSQRKEYPTQQKPPTEV